MRATIASGVAVAVLAVTAAIAHEGATGAVKVRMDSMKAIADDMKLIGRGLRGGDLDPAAGRDAAERVARHAGMMPMQFEEATVEPPSEARPVIWEEFDRFAAIAGELETAALAFAEQAAGGADPDVLRATFRDMGGTCSACHEDYRIEK